MANVDVSTYSLESVSKALTSFKNGIAGFSPNVEKEVSASISECQASAGQS